MYKEKETEIRSRNYSTVKRILPYFRPYLSTLFAVFVTLVMVTGVHLARPFILREIIDKAIPHGDLGYAMRAAGLFIVCLLVGAVAMYFRILLMSRLGAGIVAHIKRQVFEQVLRQGMKFFDFHHVGKLITRTDSDTNQLKAVFTHSTAYLFGAAMLIGGIIVIILREAPMLGAFAFGSMIVVGLVLFFYVRFIRKIYRQVREKNSELSGYLTEYVQGVPLIKVYGCENPVKKSLAGFNDEKASIERRACFIEYVLFSPSFRFFTEIGVLIVVFTYGSIEIFAGRMSVGTLIMFIELLRQFFKPLEHLVEIVAQLQSSLAAAGRVFELLDTVPDVSDEGEDIELNLKKCLEFKDITFAYKTEPVLKNVSFRIEKGRHVAIVGASGSGKTTCVNLLLRFYNPSGGEIAVDGTDIRSVKIARWRKNIALVLQEIYLFPGTIMDNIKAFDSEISDEIAITAAKQLGAHEFIMKQPNGYDTMLAERGANLSQGERQLLSYTRALVKNPEILILDEATSSVDIITERALQKSMEKLMEGRTSLIIAHRLSTIRNADNILVFSQGCLVEEGTHEALIDQNGIYRELVEIQSVSPSPVMPSESLNEPDEAFPSASEAIA